MEELMRVLESMKNERDFYKEKAAYLEEQVQDLETCLDDEKEKRSRVEDDYTKELTRNVELIEENEKLKQTVKEFEGVKKMMVPHVGNFVVELMKKYAQGELEKMEGPKIERDVDVPEAASP